MTGESPARVVLIDILPDADIADIGKLTEVLQRNAPYAQRCEYVRMEWRHKEQTTYIYHPPGFEDNVTPRLLTHYSGPRQERVEAEL